MKKSRTIDDKYWSAKFERMVKDLSKLSMTPFISWKQRMEAKGFTLRDIETTSDCDKMMNSKRDQIKQLENQIKSINAEIVVFEQAEKLIGQEKNFNTFILLCKYLNAVSKQMFVSGSTAYIIIPFYVQEQDSNIGESTTAVRFLTASWKFPTVDNPIEPGQEELKIEFSSRYTFSTVEMSTYHCLRNKIGGTPYRPMTTVKKWPGINRTIIEVTNIINENFKPEMISAIKNADSEVLKKWILTILQKEISRSTEFVLHKIRGAIHGKSYGI